MPPIREQLVGVIDCLPETEQSLLLEIARRFLPDDVATPDDLEEFRACQQGYAGISLAWNDMCRGSKHWIQGPDEAAQKIGLNPIMSGVKTEDEGLYTVQHRYWLDVMKHALSVEGEPA